ncbi:twin-arginine translocation signal domain-containing protein [Candidatus Omnitrophota bacterium]
MKYMKHNGKNPGRVLSRRSFMRTLSVGTAGATFGSVVIPGSSAALFGNKKKSRVSFVTGNDRRDMVIESLKPFKKEIKEGIRDKQVVIKTNFVSNGTPLCATHPDAVRGLLDFLEPKSFGFMDEVQNHRCLMVHVV